MKTYQKAFVAFVFFSIALTTGFSRPAPPPMSVEKIAKDIYVVKGGSGSNTGFLIGEKSVLVIDAKMTTDAAKQMIDEIKKLTPQPIMSLVITHSGGDHVNGLAGFPRGIEIISHAQTKKEMEEAFKDPKLAAL